jgi:hypothetical protein
MMRKSCRGCWRKWSQRVPTSWKYRKVSWSFPVYVYSHDAMWDKFQPAEGSFSVSLVRFSEGSSYKLVFFTAMSVDSVKKIFDDKMKELNDASSHRSLFLDNERYNNILREVKEAQISRKNNQPLTSKHYRCLKDTMSWRSVIRKKLLKVVQAKIIQNFVITERWRRVHTAQDKWRVTSNMIMNLRIPQKSRYVYYLSSWGIVNLLKTQSFSQL